MSYRAAMPTFAGGEIAPSITARYDTAKYQTALERGRNTLGLPGGGAYNRPGTEFCGPTRDYTKRTILMAFTFSTDQGYALEFSEGCMRVISGGGYVVRPYLTVTNITQANPAVMEVAGNGYEVGWDVVFAGIEGMTQINGLTARVLDVDGDLVTIDLDTTGFSAFTGSTGGVDGGSAGGEGGYPPIDPGAPPPDIPYDPDPPPTFPGSGPVEQDELDP